MREVTGETLEGKSRRSEFDEVNMVVRFSRGPAPTGGNPQASPTPASQGSIRGDFSDKTIRADRAGSVGNVREPPLKITLCSRGEGHKGVEIVMGG